MTNVNHIKVQFDNEETQEINIANKQDKYITQTLKFAVVQSAG